MNLQTFNSASDLVAYVNTMGLVQSQIVKIEQRDGKWYLFWYT
jgi:hypothetical protein